MFVAVIAGSVNAGMEKQANSDDSENQGRLYLFFPLVRGMGSVRYEMAKGWKEQVLKDNEDTIYVIKKEPEN